MKDLFSRLRRQPKHTAPETEAPINSSNNIGLENIEANGRVKHTALGAQPQTTSTQDTDSNDEAIHKDAQPGVQKMEATTQVWSKKHLIAAYVM